AAPYKPYAGQEQKAEHHIAKIAVAQRVIGPRPQPGPDHGAWKRDQRQPEHIRLDEAGADLEEERCGQNAEIEDLENAAALPLGPAAYAGPEDWQRSRESGESAQNAASKADRAIRCLAAEGDGHFLALEVERSRKDQQEHSDGQLEHLWIGLRDQHGAQ